MKDGKGTMGRAQFPQTVWLNVHHCIGRGQEQKISWRWRWEKKHAF